MTTQPKRLIKVSLPLKAISTDVVDLAPKPAQGGPQSAASAGLWSSESELDGVVFVFLRQDGGVSSYSLHIRNQQTPPEAYEMLKREL